MQKKYPVLYVLTLAFFAAIIFGSCNKLALALFTADDDKKLGAKVETEIAKRPDIFPMLDATTYAATYTYLTAMRDTILHSGKLSHTTDFPWTIYVIQNDTVVNALCTPGGYIYIYTGLLKYVDSASTLAGIMGHIMAHADQRHTANELVNKYGATALIDAALGNNQTLLTSITDSLPMAAFTKDDEKDADNHSVIYLCPTQYRSDGIADFFQKINNSGSTPQPSFLLIHPNPDNRISNIESEKSSLGCTNAPSHQVEVTDYASFKAGLP